MICAFLNSRSLFITTAVVTLSVGFGLILNFPNIQTVNPEKSVPAEVISHQKITLSFTGDAIIENVYNDVLIVNSTINIGKIIEGVDPDLFIIKLKSLHGTYEEKIAQIHSMRQKSEITDLENQALELTVYTIRFDDMRLGIEIDRMKSQKNYEIAAALEKIVELRNSGEYDRISEMAKVALGNSEGKSATMFESALSFEMIYDWTAALKYFEKSVIYARIEKEGTGRYPKIYCESLYRYGNLLFLVGEFKKAAPIFTELISLTSQDYQGSSFEKSRAYLLAGKNLIELESYPEANDVLQEAEKALTGNLSSYPIEMAMIYKLQGDVLFKLGKESEALRYYGLSEEALSAAVPLNELQKVQVLHISGKLAASLGDWKTAATKNAEEIRFAERAYGKKSIEYAEILNDAAELSFHRGEYQESTNLHGEALSSFRQVLKIDTPASFRILKGTIWTLLKTGKTEQAEKLFPEVEKLAIRFYGSQSRGYAEFKDGYSRIGKSLPQ